MALRTWYYGPHYHWGIGGGGFNRVTFNNSLYVKFTMRLFHNPTRIRSPAASKFNLRNKPHVWHFLLFWVKPEFPEYWRRTKLDTELSLHLHNTAMFVTLSLLEVDAVWPFHMSGYSNLPDVLGVSPTFWTFPFSGLCLKVEADDFSDSTNEPRSAVCSPGGI